MVIQDTMNPMVISRPHYLGDRHCGYCNGKKSDRYALESFHKYQIPALPKESESITIGFQVEQMTCKQYDQQINKGFRRSGSFLYKPDVLRSCCRMHTIRTKLDILSISKKHRQTVNRFVRAISDENNEAKISKKQIQFDLESLFEAEKKSKRFYTRFEPSSITKEKYELYKKYQVKVHNDKPSGITQGSFKRFLCDTPFTDAEVRGNKQQWDFLNSMVKNEDISSSTHSKRIGPTHECYYLDDKLIAVSFMDFLPSGVSSIYFIWDPDYAHLSLGTLSCLREILLCKKYNLGWYYLGYYIEDCPKVNYKSKFGGEILDVCNEVYFPFDKVKPFMEKGQFFVVGSNNDIEEGSLELELENNGSPQSYDESDFKDVALTNIGDEIYGSEQNYKVAENALAVLKSKYGLDNNYGNEMYALPNVLAGVIPLWQVLEWFENGIIDGEFPVSVFKLMTSQMKECTFDELDGTEKSVIVDCIRLFGLETVQEAIILMA